MNAYLDQVKMAMRAKLMPYGGLLDYRYKNLCVKTSTEALLSVEVEIGKDEFPLEKVAKAGIIDDEHFMVMPNDNSLQTAICKAFAKTHPQLKQELYDVLDNPYLEEEYKAKIRKQTELFKEQTGEDLPLPPALILITPEINDDAKKILNNTVDTLKNQCEVLYKKEYTKFKTELNSVMAKAKPEELINANRELDNEYNKLWKDVEGYTEAEREAIEKANERYHQRELQKEREENNGYTDEDAKKVQSMRFGEYEE